MATRVDVADACDWGHQASTCARLSLPGGGGVYLCRVHWDDEMRWRQERNKELSKEAQYDILPWPIWESK